MATIGQLIIAVQTSGVAEARKQLEDLDKLAASIGDKKIAAGKSGSAASSKAELDAAKEINAKRLEIAADFHDHDLNMHATNLSKMVENEAKAWGRIAKIRQKASESTGFNTGTGKIDGGGGGSGSSDSGGGGGGANTGMFTRLIGGTIVGLAARVATEAGAAIGQGILIGTPQGVMKALEGTPLLGGFVKAGTDFGKVITGQAREEMDFSNQEKVMRLRVQGASMSQSAFETAKQQASLDLDVESKKLEFQFRNGEISKQHYKEQAEAQSDLFNDRIRFAKMEREAFVGTAKAQADAVSGQLGAVSARLTGGEVAGSVASINAQRDAQMRILDIEIKRDQFAKDPAIVASLNAQRQAVGDLAAKNIELIKIEEARNVALIRGKTAASQGFTAAVGGGLAEEEMKAAQFTRQRAELVAEIARIQSMPVDATQNAQLDAGKAALSEMEAIEKRRLSIASTMAQLRVSAQTASIAELGFAMRHQTVAAADARDEEEARQKIAAIRLRGGPMAAQEMANEMEIADAKKALRQKELEETKGFMSAETAIQAKVNSGSITELDSRVRMIREKARQQAILHPEMAKEIQERAKQDEISAIRAGTQVRTVGAREANLLAFQGGRRIKERDEGEKILRPQSDSPGLTQGGKMIDALERIAENTAQQQYGRAAP